MRDAEANAELLQRSVTERKPGHVEAVVRDGEQRIRCCCDAKNAIHFYPWLQPQKRGRNPFTVFVFNEKHCVFAAFRAPQIEHDARENRNERGKRMTGITSLFSKPSTPDIQVPVVAPVAPMPVPDDAAAATARRRQDAAKQQSGRASTILTDSGGADGRLGS